MCFRTTFSILCVALVSLSPGTDVFGGRAPERPEAPAKEPPTRLRPPPTESARCEGKQIGIDFEDQLVGDEFFVGDQISAGGISVHVSDFFLFPGCGVTPAQGLARVSAAGNACVAGNDLEVNNVNLAFDFGGTATEISARYGAFGGNLNIAINGDCVNFLQMSDINGAVIGGVLVSTTAAVGCGELTLSGDVHSFRIGGQELFLDNIRACVLEPVAPVAACTAANMEVTAFEDLALGAIFSVPNVFSSGDLTFGVNPFFNGPGCGIGAAFGEVRVGALGLACVAGRELEVSNANLSIHSSAPMNRLSMRYGEYGGSLNLRINGDCQIFDNFADVAGAVIGGVDVTVVDFGLPGNGCGSLSFDGVIDTFAIGGQELFLDNLRACVRSERQIRKEPRFVRGDVDLSGEIDLGDGLELLEYLFGGHNVLPCEDAADVNDDSSLELNDAVGLFGWLFLHREAPASPTPSAASYDRKDCGVDPTPDRLSCNDPFSCS